MRYKFVIFFLVIIANNTNAGLLEHSRELDQIRSEIDVVKEKMQLITQQKNLLTEQLSEIENRYGETAALLKVLEKQIENKRENLINIRQQVDIHNNEIKKHGKALSSQIRSAYAMGKQEKLKLILNMEDPSLSSRMIVYYSYLNKRRLQKLAEITDTVKKLEELSRQQQKETALLEIDLEKKKIEQTSLDKLRYERNELLVNWTKDFSSHEQQLNDLMENEKKLNDLVHALEKKEKNSVAHSPPNDSLISFRENNIEKSEKLLDSGDTVEKQDVDFSDLKGSLPWPVTSKTSTDAGKVNVETLMDGVLINAGEGTDIHAVTAGKVVYSEWLRGYGLLIIIDHGKGYMTLYAFNQSLYKRTGEWVKGGETIASVGQSGGRSRPGLYFGIRKNGKPVDPLEWCKKIKPRSVRLSVNKFNQY